MLMLVEKMIGRIVKWLKVGGHIFIRESCFHQSGDSKRKVNPTHYREPRFYTKIFKECHSYDQEGNSFELSLVTSKCIGAYVKSKKNQNQEHLCRWWICGRRPRQGPSRLQGQFPRAEAATDEAEADPGVWSSSLATAFAWSSQATGHGPRRLHRAHVVCVARPIYSGPYECMSAVSSCFCMVAVDSNKAAYLAAVRCYKPLSFSFACRFSGSTLELR